MTTTNYQNSQLIRTSRKIWIHFIHKESIQIMHLRKGLTMIQISRMPWGLPTFLKFKESHQRIRSCHQVLGCRAARIVSRALRTNSRSLRPTMIPSWRWTPRWTVPNSLPAGWGIPSRGNLRSTRYPWSTPSSKWLTPQSKALSGFCKTWRTKSAQLVKWHKYRNYRLRITWKEEVWAKWPTRPNPNISEKSNTSKTICPTGEPSILKCSFPNMRRHA